VTPNKVQAANNLRSIIAGDPRRINRRRRLIWTRRLGFAKVLLRRSLRRWAGLIMFAKLVSPRYWLPIIVMMHCAGCNLLLDDTPARDESFREAAGYDRAPAEKGTLVPWGVSSRSREVERDLGVK